MQHNLNANLIRRLQKRLASPRLTTGFSMDKWLGGLARSSTQTSLLPAEDAPHAHSCGTTACIAGHVVLMIGSRIQVTRKLSDRMYQTVERRRYIFPGDRVEGVRYRTQLWSVESYAAKQLGLTSLQQSQLLRMTGDPTLPPGTNTWNLPQLPSRKQAIIALQNMIDRGEPRWGEVLNA